jgi:hypothetical protein
MKEKAAWHQRGQVKGTDDSEVAGDSPSDNAYLVSKWLKQGIKLKGYYPSESNASKRKYIKTFMEHLQFTATSMKVFIYFLFKGFLFEG